MSKQHCNNCAEEVQTKPETIPYVVHEAVVERESRHTKGWIIAFFVALGMLFGTNIGWLIYESQFETYYYEQDGEGVNIIGNENEVSDGAEA